MIYFNYHTHTEYCDGKAIPEDFVKRAIELGMESLGFSAHSPLPFTNTYSIKQQDIQAYKNEIRRLQEVYNESIQIFLAMEFDLC